MGVHTWPLLGPTIKPEREVFSAAISTVVWRCRLSIVDFGREKELLKIREVCD